VSDPVIEDVVAAVVTEGLIRCFPWMADPPQAEIFVGAMRDRGIDWRDLDELVGLALDLSTREDFEEPDL